MHTNGEDALVVRVYRSGYTLVEMVIVVMILGILAAVGAPRYYSSLVNYRGDATARRITADLEIAKRRARQISANQTVAFDVLSNRYQVVGMPDLNHPDRTYEFDFADDTYKATLVSADFGGSSNLFFDMYGRPIAAGTVVFHAGGNNIVISIDDSGHIDTPTRNDIAVSPTPP